MGSSSVFVAKSRSAMVGIDSGKLPWLLAVFSSSATLGDGTPYGTSLSTCGVCFDTEWRWHVCGSQGVAPRFGVECIFDVVPPGKIIEPFQLVDGRTIACSYGYMLPDVG